MSSTVVVVPLSVCQTFKLFLAAAAHFLLLQGEVHLNTIWGCVHSLRVSFCLITLIKCLKGHKSLGSLCSVLKTLIVSLVGPTKGRTMSPIELFWTAKK